MRPAVVLEAGLNSGSPAWGRVMPLLAPHVRVAAYDRAGIGGVRPGPPVTIETRQIADWGIWVDGRGVVEGAGTEGTGHHLS